MSPPQNDWSLFGRDVVATETFVIIGQRCGQHKRICYYWVAMWSSQKDLLLLRREVVAKQSEYAPASNRARTTQLYYGALCVLVLGVLLNTFFWYFRLRMVCYCWVAMWSPLNGLLLLALDVVGAEGFVTIWSRCGRHRTVCYYWVAMWSTRKYMLLFRRNVACTEGFVTSGSRCRRHIGDVLLLGRDVVATERFVSIGLRCGRHRRICYYWAAVWSTHTDLLLLGRDVVIIDCARGGAKRGNPCPRRGDSCGARHF